MVNHLPPPPGTRSEHLPPPPWDQVRHLPPPPRPGPGQTSTPLPGTRSEHLPPSPPGPGQNIYPLPPGTRSDIYPLPPSGPGQNIYPLPPRYQVRHLPPPPLGTRSEHLPPPPPVPGQTSTTSPPLRRLHAGGRYASHWNAFLLTELIIGIIWTGSFHNRKLRLWLDKSPALEVGGGGYFFKKLNTLYPAYNEIDYNDQPATTTRTF